MSLTLKVFYTATNRVILVHDRDGHITSTYNLPVFPHAMRLVYEKLHYTIREFPYQAPYQEVPDDTAA